MLVEDNQGWEFVGEAGSVKATIRLARELRPDLIILDLFMDKQDKECPEVSFELTM